ncbi:MAG: alpha/beta fold hydrolase [Chloroflexi bacterium]|nr:alpha/beta fold hydrolase [Verrucomicrobiota bacterium]MBI5828406.1 alpha/beta fold hydrolase [Chloroflexota bacterium]
MKQIAAFCLAAALCPTNLFAEPRTEDVTFRANCDGTEQKYVVVFPDGFSADKPHAALIVLHGHGSDRWQFVKSDRDECRAVRDVAFANGMLLVSPDYRAKTSWMGPKAEADMAQIITEVKQRHRVTQIILCGGSMGGTGALTFAALHPDPVDGVVSLNGTANPVEIARYADAIAASFGGTKAQVPDEYRRRSAESWPERFMMPVAATTGGKDRVVPPDSVRRLLDAVKAKNANVLLIHRPEAAHSTNYEDAKTAIEFVVSKVLK